MRRVRASSVRRVVAAAAVVDVTAVVADTVAAGVTVVVASEEEAATSKTQGNWQMWAGLDSNQRRLKDSRFTVCPVWPLRYLPVSARDFIYPCASQLAT